MDKDLKKLRRLLRQFEAKLAELERISAEFDSVLSNYTEEDAFTLTHQRSDGIVVLNIETSANSSPEELLKSLEKNGFVKSGDFFEFN
jgi:hypothetical protein